MNLSELSPDEMVWLGIGLVGQWLFPMRVLFQWLRGERQPRSVIPAAFCYFSIADGLILPAYAINRRDRDFIREQDSCIFIYRRNLYFAIRERRRSSIEAVAS